MPTIQKAGYYDSWDPTISLRQIFEIGEFVQEPPRKRTIFSHARSAVPTKGYYVDFPWVTTGSYILSIPSCRQEYWVTPLVFVHERPWTGPDDFFDIVKNLPFHAIDFAGGTCVGPNAQRLLTKGEITPAEAFWMTSWSWQVVGSRIIKQWQTLKLDENIHTPPNSEKLRQKFQVGAGEEILSFSTFRARLQVRARLQGVLP